MKLKLKHGVIAGLVVVGGGIIANYFNTTTRIVKVPCTLVRYDTTQQSVKLYDTTTVSYKTYDTTYIRRYRRRSKMVITTNYKDSLHITSRDSSFPVITPVEYSGFCDSTVTDTTNPPPVDTIKTKFGALVSDDVLKPAQKISVWKLYKIPYARTQTMLKDFTGTDKSLQQWIDSGATVSLNINWQTKEQNTSKKFIRDTVLYAQKLDLLFEKYGKSIAFGVIENEVLTKNYFDDDMKYYIIELRVALREAAKYGVTVTNSGDHLEYIPFIYDGQATTSDRVANCKYLMEHYKGMGLPFINTHSGTLFDNGQPSDAQMTKIANYIRTTTGVNDLISNEVVLRDSTKSYVDRVVHCYRFTNFSIAIDWDGQGTDLGALPLHIMNQVKVSPLGNTFINSVSSQSN